MNKVRELLSTIVVLVVACPLSAAEGQYPARAGSPAGIEQGQFGVGGAPLFDSIDESGNPVSMADMIAGRPLVLIVSSCTCQPGFLNFQVVEELYQEYKDRVNFRWVYAAEAHPEEFPFGGGFDTENLGWTHDFDITISMQERRDRARWLKADLEPDAEIPMMIDYIDSDLGPNNAIWNAYTGGGFYASFLIDCDATLMHTQNWAWFEHGSQWWFLPLAPADNLRSFLDAYLADPPACYDPSAAPFPPYTSHGAEKASGQQGGLATILIVDDDGGSEYEGYFKIPLGNMKKHFDVWEVQENGSPPAEVLQNYEAVAWLTGDTLEDTLSPTDQANLATYLDGNGKLFLSGQNIGQDIGDTAFYRDYLHATEIAGNAGVSGLVGNDILDGVQVTLSGGDGADNQDSPSEIGLLHNAIGVFRYGTEGSPAWGGLRWAGNYKVVYFAFGVEGIGDRGAAVFRFAIISAVFGWFDEVETIPAVSQWGLLVMMLLSLIAGTLVLSRANARRRPERILARPTELTT